MVAREAMRRDERIADGARSEDEVKEIIRARHGAGGGAPLARIAGA